MEIVHKKEFESSRFSVEGRSAQKGVHHSALESPNDFLKQIEPLDPSGLAASLIGILESTETSLYNSKGMTDLITHEGILTEFLQGITHLVNREMQTGKYRLDVEEEDVTNSNNSR
jgi:hypothetical protein